MHSDEIEFFSGNNPIAGIVGLGVMGGSFASKLSELGFDVVGFDPDEDVLRYALDCRMISAGTTDPEVLLPECDLVIFCLYPKKFRAGLRNTALILKKTRCLWRFPA